MDALQAGRTAWPGLEVPAPLFEKYLAERSQADSDHAADLYLACACVHQLPGAAAAFERAFMGAIPKLLRRLRPTPTFVEEVAQLLREKLLVGAAPRIADYSGKGTLLSWLRVVAVRAALDLKRTRGERPEEELDYERHLVAGAASPEEEALRRQSQPLFKEAFGATLATLTSGQRNLLRLHYVDGLTMEELGRLLQVNRSTIFRRLGACTEALLEGMRDRLALRGITDQEFDSLANAMQSRLELSISGWFKSQR